DIFYFIGFIHFCQSYQGISDFTDAISEGFLTLEFTFAIYEKFRWGIVGDYDCYPSYPGKSPISNFQPSDSFFCAG
ncbi:MAG: hypothetical protein LBR68_07280, partial [Lachnoclostridium sp.]|nr:hypothetical protein [Lachnoclostridium sp.]